MLYRDIKRAVLSHIDQYSNAGQEMAPTYNNQADALNRIPIFINEGLTNILTLVKPQPVLYRLQGGQELGNMLQFTLPPDFWALKSGGVFRIREGKFQKTNEYRVVGKKQILIPRDHPGDVYIEYNRYPHLLPLVSVDGVNPTALDDYELDEDIDVIQTATYYAAAQLVMRDDSFLYASLYNDYESRLGRLSNGISAEVHATDDAYAPDGAILWGGWEP